MLGALITLAFCVAMTSLGRLVLRRVGLWKTEELNDPALLLALSGLLALGMVGTLTLFIGFLPGGFRWGLVVCALLALVGVAGLVGPAGNLRPRLPQEMRGVGILHFAAISVAFLFALIGALAPSDVNDWDTLAYHLAVPKLWIQAGQITYIPFIHHSNFPFAVDNLYIWGLQWGGESGAKAFMVAYFGLGILAVFGFARQRYGPSAAPWAALVFGTVPVVLWESGTAYIDVAHGVYAGVGVLLAALWAEHKGRQSALLWLAALHLGLAAGSKYTGLQTILAVGLVLVWLVLTRRDGSRPRIGPVLVAGAIALLLASPWYVKNAVVNGNPVYPFFYEVFGGRNWSSEHAAVYRDEQQTFGVGRHGAGRDWSALGHAVWGLAYQPGRYVNPGQTQGLGSPLGAVGVPLLGALLLWLVAGRGQRGASPFESSTLSIVLVSLVMWFALSQQSRYIVSLAPPLSVLAAGAVLRLRAGALLGFVAAAQALFTLWLAHFMLVSTQLQIVTGRIDRQQYVEQTTPFAAMAPTIDREVGEGKVALYDEVFGYFLEARYVWANPGHSTLIPYASLETGPDFADELSRQSFTHVFVSMSPIVRDPEFARRWIEAMGLNGAVTPLPEQETLKEGFQTRWIVLLADAVAKGRLRPVAQERAGILFEVAPN